MDKYFVLDTNVLLDNPEIVNTCKSVILSHVLRELEKHKLSNNNELAFRARRCTRYLELNSDQVKFDLKDYNVTFNEIFDNNYVDNKIIQSCIENKYGLITFDLLLKFKAKGYGIEIVEIDNRINDDYKGFKEVILTDEELASIYENQFDNPFGLLINEYLIIKSDDRKASFELNNVRAIHRWNGTELVDLRLPSKKIISPKNPLQSCALDTLYNKDIPIKIIAGTYGSGKTMLSVAIGVYYVEEKGAYKNLLIVRNPTGAGEEIGFIKGDKEDKTKDFFKPVVQHIGEDKTMVMERNERLKKEIPFYMKGLDISDTYILVDEAEDLNIKTIKLIGTRLAEGSVIAFAGDYKQAEERYSTNNGLKQAIEKLKDNPLVGIIVLDEDIRSEASKVFADF